MTTTELPPALRPWSESLGFLTVEAALHIGPLVRRLDALVRRHDATNTPRGEPDGYGGLTNRGHPERLLLSEWLLAEELPLEFVRRAANRELLHIDPTFRAAQPEGSVAVFCDCGPDQLGAARLVQLAALIVLHRRASTRGPELRLGLSGEPADRWRTGELPELFHVWREAASPEAPGRDELVQRAQAGDELWVLAGDALAAAAHDRKLLLHTRESAYDAHGVTAVDVRFEGRTTTLPVPPGRVSVQTLRGQMLRRHAETAAGTSAAALSCPSFGADRRLLLRGERPELLVVTTIPTNTGGGVARPRTHRFSGPVVAASSLGGKRLLALTLHGDALRCEVVGKSLSMIERMEIRLADIELDRDDLDLTTLPPVFFDRRSVLFRLGDAWWSCERDEAPFRDDRIIAVAHTRHIDQPQLVTLDNGRLYNFAGAERIEGGRHHPRQAIASHGRIAWTEDGPWTIAGRSVHTSTIEVDDGDVVLGVLADQHEEDPALVTMSRSGLIVRIRSRQSVHTLTDASGPALGHALQARLGLLAVQRDERSVDVLDVDSGDVVASVRVQ